MDNVFFNKKRSVKIEERKIITQNNHLGTQNNTHSTKQYYDSTY
jgi:hypothetical protein